MKKKKLFMLGVVMISMWGLVGCGKSDETASQQAKQISEVHTAFPEGTTVGDVLNNVGTSDITYVQLMRH